MNPRTVFGITAALLCHLLLATPLVTSQLPPNQTTASGPATSADLQDSGAPQEGPVLPVVGAPKATIRAREQEKRGDLFILRGDVEIEYQGRTVRADEITYDRRTGEITATGHLLFEGGPHDEHIEASHGSYNVRTETGKFYDVVGTTGARFRGRGVVLTSSAPFAFSGKLVEKTGPERYVIHHGSVTSCELPNPKWTFNAEKIVVDVGGTARIYGSTFRVKKVPIFYFPFAAHPVERLGRQTGFLVPSAGTSSVKGTILGESFYWAINRSMDATIGAEYFSSRGWAQHGSFRARPSDTSFVNFSYFGVLDRGVGNPKVNQGGQDIHLNAEALFPHDVRGVASLNYLSSFVFRLAFVDTFSQAVNSEVNSIGFLSKNFDGFSFNGMASRYQNFQSTTPGDVVSILHVPSFEASSVDRKIGHSPVYWSFDAAADGVQRSEPINVTTGVVGRFDVNPDLSLPLVYHGWTLRPSAGLRETYYTEQQFLLGIPQDPINRFAFDGEVELRPPAVARIFQKPIHGRVLKHVIEPRVIYRYVSGVENFDRIIRFDARDILSDTNEVEYGVINRLYAKRTSGVCENEVSPVEEAPPQPPTSKTEVVPGQKIPPRKPEECPGSVREVFSWELAQKYFADPTFGGAVVPGTRNVFTTTADFTGIAFLTEPRHFSPILSKMRLQTSNNTDVEWHLDYDPKKGRINASTTFLTYRFGDWFVGGSHTFLQTPAEVVGIGGLGPNKFNQFRILTGYGSPEKRGLSAAANVGFDSNFQFLQYGAFQWSYNWDCCGISMEYRRFALGSVRNENQFRFAFTLANIGTFGNLKRQERLF